MDGILVSKSFAILGRCIFSFLSSQHPAACSTCWDARLPKKKKGGMEVIFFLAISPSAMRGARFGSDVPGVGDGGEALAIVS